MLYGALFKIFLKDFMVKSDVFYLKKRWFMFLCFFNIIANNSINYGYDNNGYVYVY